MPALSSREGRDRLLNNFRKLQSRRNRFFLTLKDNFLRHPRSKSLFSVLVKNFLQIFITPGVHDIVSRKALGRVHPHVQFRILIVTESPLADVELEGGNTQIIENPVDFADIFRTQSALEVDEIVMEDQIAVRDVL